MFAAVPLWLRIEQVYRVAPGSPARAPMSLLGMICFSGRHYVSYFSNAALQQWVFIDDALVQPVGSWDAARAHATANRQMPLILFYIQTATVRA